jgi:hypothetical protein
MLNKNGKFKINKKNLRLLFNLIFRLPKKQKINPHLLKEFSMNGKIPVKYWFLDESYGENDYISFSKDQIKNYLKKIKKGKKFHYGNTDKWLYNAINKYPLKNKSVAIMGSNLPVYESISLFYGGKPTTIEYNKIKSQDKRIKTMKMDEYNMNPIKFDVAFSISSFEHDGLGRYGDRINPNGDLEAMKKMKKIVKKNGLLFLAVPIGKDSIIINAHRIYGEIRFPLLINGWEIVDSFGFTNDSYNKDLGKMHGAQPVFVLRNV